jgi:lipopolysaccharide heptosyltransferase II
MTIATSRWKPARRILCVRLDNMGDVLMSTPAMRALKEGRPDRSITLWTSSSGQAVAQLIPEIDDTLVAGVPWMKVPDADAGATATMVEELRAGAFDAAVIFTVHSQSPLPAALMCHLAGIPRVLAHCRENPYHLLSDWVLESEPAETVRHEVQRQLDLVATVGAHTMLPGLSLLTRAEDAATLAQGLLRHGVTDNGGWIVAHCGATAPSRRYPAEQFSQVIARLCETHGTVLLTGSESEYDLVADVARRAGEGAVNLAGELTLGEMAVLIEKARILVSNNSGPVHMAAATGTPVVVLYALTNPQHTPWKVPHRVINRDVPCKYCYRSVCPQGHHACLALVEPGEVVAAVQGLLHQTGRLPVPMMGLSALTPVRGGAPLGAATVSLHED